MLRKTIFWIHLACGVVTGVVILIMSVTGVLLTYERQMLAAAERSHYLTPAPGAERLPVDALLAAGKLAEPDLTPTSLTYDSTPGAPVTLSAGRRGSIQLDPYMGDARPEAAPRMAAFFDAMTGWHRWFNATGDSRGPARAVTGASNLAFLFLILSGLYLWLPRMYRWALFKARLAFNASYPNAKARDFNWHHVIGFWTAIPLAVVVATASVFSYGWASDLVYLSFGEDPPGRGGRGSANGTDEATAAATGPRLELDALLDRAVELAGDDWQRITLNLPDDHAQTVGFRIDRGNGGQPQHRHEIELDAHTGAVHASEPFGAQTPGRRARTIIRYLHTGEVLGLVGQTIAGLVSLTSILMVWTGFALAYRRLIAPLFKR